MPRFIWTTEPPSASALRRDGYHVVPARRFLAAVRKARSAGTERGSLRNPAGRWLQVLDRRPRIAVLGLACKGPGELARIVSYLVEPVYRRGGELRVHADRTLDDLAAGDDLIDPDWRYPWTVERLVDLARRFETAPNPRPARVAGWRRLVAGLSRRDDTDGEPTAGLHPTLARLDPNQRAAVLAGDGVVQVIAPAGSGKTTVLIARVAELVRRGTPPGHILCTSFNRDAKLEIAARLESAGLAGVEVRSFHGLGLRILREEGRLRPRIGTVGHAQWRRLAREAVRAEPEGAWLDPGDAQAAVSEFKLAAMVTPAEARAAAASALGRTAARLYALYEEQQAQAGQFDFDDLIVRTVRLLQDDAAVRRRWQDRFERVLVDEYQDIEPAQALLVGILAAPQDSLFCVGDEDQCIYAWRRASVQRVVELDQVYPGLERFSLAHNYRCGRRITRASRRLIEHNRQRFRKPLRAGARQPGEIAIHSAHDLTEGATTTAAMIAGAERGEVAVLARTSSLLRRVALACGQRGLEFAASDKVFRLSAAARTLGAYLRLLADSTAASAADVEHISRVPPRGLPDGAARGVATALRQGESFTAAFSSASTEPWRRKRLIAAGALLDDLARERGAQRIIARLRQDGGLDAHLAAQERLDGTERVQVEELAHAQRVARGKTAATFAAELAAEAELLARFRRDDAVELATVHGSKGREWDRVILFGADQGQFPHLRSADDATEGELEDERRLFYVALTRAKMRLDVVCTRGRESQFLQEAGIE